MRKRRKAFTGGLMSEAISDPDASDEPFQIRTSGSKGACMSRHIRTIQALALILSTLILVTSCLSMSERALEALNDGNYFAAAQYAFEALKEEPGDPAVRTILDQSYANANREWHASIEQALAQEEPQRQEQALALYDKLIAIHTLYMKNDYTSVSPVPDPEALKERRDAVQKEIAKLYLNQGSSLYYKGTRESARQAVLLIRTAFSLDPDLKTRFTYILDSAVKKATVRVFVFTGPDTNFYLNGVEIVSHLEDLLDSREFVEAVRVPARYAAPVDDDHNAKDFARGHGADLMLHIEPSTTYSVKVRKESESLSIATWEMEHTSLESAGESQVRMVLIDLSNDSVLHDSTINVTGALKSKVTLHSIRPTGTKRLQLHAMQQPRDLKVHTVPAGVNSMNLNSSLLMAGIDLPDWGFETGLEPFSVKKIDPSSYGSLPELENLKQLNDHTFFLFDVIEYDPYADSQLSYDYTYGAYLGEDVEGRLATSASERELYQAFERILTSEESKKELQKRFLETFYRQTIAEAVAKASIDLF